MVELTEKLKLHVKLIIAEQCDEGGEDKCCDPLWDDIDECDYG